MRILIHNLAIINLDHLVSIEFREPSPENSKPALFFHLSDGNNLQVEAGDKVLLENLLKTLGDELRKDNNVPIDLASVVDRL